MKRPDIFQAGIALLVGTLFALGLGISGMTQPQKVIGFLKIGSGWNPALIFVMLRRHFRGGDDRRNAPEQS